MKLISVKEQPEYQEAAIQYFQKRWGSEETNALYADAISHAVTSDSPLPQWYLLYKNQQNGSIPMAFCVVCGESSSGAQFESSISRAGKNRCGRIGFQTTVFMYRSCWIL